MDLSRARAVAGGLVSRMTAEEKISQLVNNSPAIERLGIKEYNWWNEAAHGVARAGIATVFPQAIAMAATFDPVLTGRIAEAVSVEARAKYNKNVAFEDRDIFKGLTFWTPNINIFRDPRWGRGQETFGEDPFLTAAMGTAYIKGLQGDGAFLRAAACAKHFAVHSGPEKERHTFNAEASEKDMNETYLPAFEQAVKAGVAGVMGAYNRLNGQPCCAHEELMEQTLFKKWGFAGYFVSDCGAIYDICNNHHYTETVKEAAAAALKCGCDLNCGAAYAALIDAYEEDLISDADLTRAALRLFTIRAALGEFEQERPFSDIGYDKLDCAEHKALNLQAARQAVVLLKNEGDFLPLERKKVGKIAVIGPNALSKTALEGNYNGHASEYITVADGIRRVFPETRVMVADGSQLYKESVGEAQGFGNLRSEGLAAASEADVTVLCLGLDRTVEGEEIYGLDEEFGAGGDKKTLHLPATQMRLAEAVCDVCPNVIVVVMTGSAVDLGEKVRQKAKAILHAWYPGAQGGLAVAEMIGGLCSPCGKLPVTFYSAQNALPAFTDYGMDGRTYRFLREKPLYPFGYGLSYTSFAYRNLCAQQSPERVTLTVTVQNTGHFAATEKIQVYARFTDSRTPTPNFQLCALRALPLHPGEEQTVTLEIDRYWLKAVLADGSRVEPESAITLFIGNHQPDERSRELCGDDCLNITL